MNKAIFLDRDGTINVDVGHLSKVEDLKIIDGTLKALKTFKEKGYLIIVVTNQSAISRGMLTHEGLNEIHEVINKELDYLIDYFFYCPHSPTEQCKCRKPSAYMLNQAKEMFDIDFSQSWFIGDKDTDMFCGKSVGCKTIGLSKNLLNADYTSKNLYTARKIICKQ
jgi:D,D-heptose 1,7-bisphosphate phosphatase